MSFQYIDPTALLIRLLVAIVLLHQVGSAAAGLENESARLQIINGSAESIEVEWIETDQRRRHTALVPAAASVVIETTIGHTHALMTAQGKEVARVVCCQRLQAFRFQREGQCDLAQVAQRVPPGRIVPVTPEMSIPDFYSKIIFAQGYPIVGSPRVNDYALKEAAWIVDQLLSHRTDVRQAMIASGSRLCLMSHDEFTTDLPEFRHLAKSSPVAGVDGGDYWDARARGLGGSDRDPYCSCGEENLLGFPGDPYSSESILIHEFAHNIHLRGLSNVDPTFDVRLRAAYETAIEAGLWKGKYASTNHHEYFAEGVQSWFNANRENDHDHNYVNTREELIDYDPGLANLCAEIFGKTDFRYTPPASRIREHLLGYEMNSSPEFRWPSRLQHAHAAIQQ